MTFLIIMDDNIHKSQALKRQHKLTFKLVRSELHKLNVRKSVSEFAAKLLETGYYLRTYLHFQALIKEMLRFKIVPCCPENHYSKNQIKRIIISYKKLLPKILKSACLKWTHGLFGLPNCCRNAKFEIYRTIVTCLN